jgi:ribonuclease HII
MRAVLRSLAPPAEACLVDGFRLGPSAPEHTAIVDGDTKSAAIAAASVIAKVTRDRLMRRMDALYPHYGFSSHVGYITPAHTAIVRERGPSPIHRRSWRARAYMTPEEIEAELNAELSRVESP